MATVRNTIMMKDGMGSVLKSLIRDMDMTMGTMQRLDMVSDKLNLGSSFDHASASAAALNRNIEPLDDSLRRAGEEQRKFNNRIRDGDLAASTLRSTLATIGGVIGIQKIVAISDEFVQTSARLDQIKGQFETLEDLQSKIFSAAFQSRGLYTDMAASVSKLGMLAGNAFGNTDEIIRFTELYQKMSVVGGSSAEMTSAAMYQLTQAMASGRLQGDEYKSIIENASMLAGAIEGYMKNAGVEGTMKDWASEGLLTSDVIKAAMFSVADDVDAAFEKMPMTWGQVWNGAVNKALIVSQPLLKFVNLLANNWSILEPIVIAAGVAALAYGSALLIHAGAMGASSLATTIHTAFTSGWTIATFKATLAQDGLNAALLACPITWIVGGIMLLTAIFYGAVAAVNKFTGTTYSATGLIMGAFFVLGAFIYNNFIAPTWNAIATLVNFFANVWNDPITAVQLGFYTLAMNVIGYVLSMASAIEDVINKIPGVEVSITGGLDSFYSQLETAADKAKNKFEWVDYVGKLGSIAYGDAWDKGYGIGSGLQDKVTGMFGSGFSMDDFAGSMADQDYDVNVKDDVNLADESMAYLMDAVAQRYVNHVNFEAPAPQVTVNFNGDIHKDVDLDALAEQTEKKIGGRLAQYRTSSPDIIY